eukprot:CAMPEP_0114993456 /NCGR_PEP_ID=MMETSP0216-20121206/12541_1 /TAXON_ID=223996 /ORGANISM="Protocruzia adherens, Strain Boccale" /LENGTH=255 /DNA_ID=CAMNT_0002357103 /DNA_START=35 /DNA_END=799 /DNA_ORIENTATION=-
MDASNAKLTESKELLSLSIEVGDVDKAETKRSKMAFNRLIGICCMILSQLFLFCSVFLLKIISTDGIQGFQLMTFRGVAMLVGTTAVVRGADLSMKIPAELRVPLVLRGLFGFLAYIGYVYGSFLLKMAEAQSIILLSPFISALLAYFFLKEKLGRIQIASIVASFVGVIIVLKPTYLFGLSDDGDETNETSTHPSYYVFPVMSAVFSALAFYQIRRMGKQIHYVIPVYSFAIFITVFAPILQLCVYGSWKSLTW